MSKDEMKESELKKNYDPFNIQIGGNHYAHFAIQPGEFISKNKLEWYEGNIIKYVTRSRFKGQKLEDLKKARHYLDMAIAEEEAKPKIQAGEWKTVSSAALQTGACAGGTYGYFPK